MTIAAEGEAIQFLLDGLGIESLTDLKTVVDDGRYYRFMLTQGFSLRRETKQEGDDVTAP